MKFLSFAALISSACAFAPQPVPVKSGTALAARKPFISGNWKLNPQTRDEAVQLAGDIAAAITDKSPKADVALFVPYVFIEAAQGAVDGKILVGAEVSSSLCWTCSGVCVSISNSGCICLARVSAQRLRELSRERFPLPC